MQSQRDQDPFGGRATTINKKLFIGVQFYT